MDPIDSLVARKDQIETLLSNIDFWLIIFGAFVVIGVAGESVYGIRAYFNSKELRTVTQKIDDLRAEAARQKEKELDARVAEAEAKTAEANSARTKLEAKLAPRVLTPAQIAALADQLRGSPVKSAGFYVYGSSPEMVHLSQQVGEALRSAGWHWNGWSVSGTQTVAGIVVDVIEGASNDTVAAGQLLVRAFQAVGLASAFGPRFPETNALPGVLMGGPGWDPKRDAVLRINLGAKP